jgi:POT family proton-dependent oligopeptide transporter
MGIWYLSSFLAMVVGGKLAGLTGKIEQGKIQLPWHFGGQADFFFLFVVSSLGAGVLILLLTPLLKKLIARREE